jgi:hypothetical protein
MRPLFLVLALAAQTAAAANFPPAAAPEQPVSEPVFSSAAGDQQTLAIASNGSIGFAVWLDTRRGATDLYGSRIDASGVSLDPLGIRIATGVTGGTAIWNGSNFVVVSERGSDKTFSFVTAEGAIVDRKTMTLLYMSVAATLGSGPDARILFAGFGRATIVDSNANIVMANVQLAMPTSQSFAIAAGGANEFLILHTNLVPNRHLFADRLDRDGKLLGSADSGVDFNVIGATLSLAGGDDGYLLVGRGVIERDIIAAHLDHNGVVISQRSLAAYPLALRVSLVPRATPAVLRDGDHYEVTWTTSEGNGDAHTWRVIEPAAGGAQTEPARILDWTGSGYGTTIGKIASQSIVVTDALRAGVSTNIDPVATSIANALSSSATQQTLPQIASLGNDYAVIWNEFGPDGSAHLYLKRSTTSVPIEVASNTAGRAITGRIAAADGTYVVAWTTTENGSGSVNYAVRRMSAATGEWLDADPALLTNAFELVLASNGENVLAAYAADCLGRCIHIRPIAAHSADAFAGAETTIPGTTQGELALASNGHDYLLAWNDSLCISFGCDVQFPSRLLAMRLASDGHALHFAPIVIDDTQSFSHYPTVAWTGSAYAVAWDVGDTINGRHVSAAGSTDAVRTIIARPPLLRTASLVASGNNLFLLFLLQTSDVRSTSGVAIDPQALTASGAPTELIRDQPGHATISAAPLAAGIVIAYDRVDPAAGNVGRVFTRSYGDVPRRRAAHP